MTSDAKLPIPTYDIHGYGSSGRSGHRSMSYESIEARPEHPGDWCKADDVREMLKMQIAADGARGSMMIDLRDRCCRAEAQRDRLIGILRLALELAEDQDDNLGSWCEVWEQAAQALADTEKENA